MRFLFVRFDRRYPLNALGAPVVQLAAVPHQQTSACAENLSRGGLVRVTLKLRLWLRVRLVSEVLVGGAWLRVFCQLPLKFVHVWRHSL